MPVSRDDISVIILTCERPADLKVSLESVLRQDPLPGEIIIVDDGDLEVAPIRRMVEGSGVRLVYHHKEKRGIARSRNVGARLARGSLLMYLDDDQVMVDGYIRNMARLFDEDTDRSIVGIGGEFDQGESGRPGRLDPFWRLVESVFLLRGGRHQVLCSGFSNPRWSGRSAVEEVSFLSGCASYRKEIFDRFAFDEGLEAFGPYAFGEDLAFSFQAGQHGRLLITPEAGVIHHRSAASRPTTADLAHLRLYNQYYIYSRYFRPRFARPACFAWAVLGKCVLGALRFALNPKRENWQHLKGTLSGTAFVTRLAVAGGIRAEPPQGANA